jgi:hypothetical protein
VIYGGGHFTATSRNVTIRDRIEHDHPGALFVLVEYAGFVDARCSERFEARAINWPKPALIAPVAGTSLQGDLRMTGCSFLHRAPAGTGRASFGAEQEARAEDAESGAASDGLLYFGPAKELTTSPWEESLVMDEAYIREISRRQSIEIGRPFQWTDALDENTQGKLPYSP